MFLPDTILPQWRNLVDPPQNYIGSTFMIEYKCLSSAWIRHTHTHSVCEREKYQCLTVIQFRTHVFFNSYLSSLDPTVFQFYFSLELLNEIFDAREIACLAGVYGDCGGAWVDEE